MNDVNRPEKPYSMELLRQRREALERGRRASVARGRFALGLALTAGALLGAHELGKTIETEPTQRDRQEQVLAQFAATSPNERGAYLIRLCNDPSFDRAVLPVGAPECPEPSPIETVYVK